MTMESRDIRIRRLIYQSSYTGTRETDLLLGQFATLHLTNLSEVELDDYEALLIQGDQNILAWVRGDLKIPANLDGNVFALIKDFNATL
jgi:antitoxin CptB